MSRSDYTLSRLYVLDGPNLLGISPSSGRKSPNSGRKSPNSGMKSSNSGRKSPNSGKKSPNNGLMISTRSPDRNRSIGSPDRSSSKLIIANRSSPIYTPDIKARYSFGSPEVKSDRDSSSKVSIFDKYYSPSPDLFLSKSSPQLDNSRVSDGSPEGNAKVIAGMDPELQKIYNQLRWGLYNQVQKKFSKAEYQVKSTSSRYLSLLLILLIKLLKDLPQSIGREILMGLSIIMVMLLTPLILVITLSPLV